jgi:ureidoglycolate lyase
MASAEALTNQHVIPARELTEDAFRPFGEIIKCRSTVGQFGANPDPENSSEEVNLVLTNGQPRLWIMHVKGVGVTFSKMARHRRVTQCLGSLGSKDWLIGVAPAGDLDDSARPGLDEVTGFRIPGDCVIKLHVATWHAGPHLFGDEGLFINLENMDTNKHDFHSAELPVECRFAV